MTPQLTLSPSIEVTYETREGHVHHAELAREPSQGLSAIRMDQMVKEFCAALTQRQQCLGGDFYATADERSVHVKWLSALADVMEREAQMHRTLAGRLGDTGPRVRRCA